MKQVMKKTVALVLSLMIAVTGISLNGTRVNAASYPMFFSGTLSQEYYIGETAVIDYTIYPEYKNEKILVSVYDSDGNCVGSAEEDFYNYNIFTRDWSLTWDTKGEKPGKYTVVTTMQFYTYFEWRECPNAKTTYITLKKKPKNGVSIKSVKNVKGYKIKASWKKVKNAKKYEVKIGNKKYKTKKTTFTSKKLKKTKWYTVKVRAYVKGKYGPWSPAKEVYTEK